MGKLTLLALTLASMVLSCAASGAQEKYDQRLKWFTKMQTYMTAGERETHQRELDALKREIPNPAKESCALMEQMRVRGHQACDEVLRLVKAGKFEESDRLGQRLGEDLEYAEKGDKILKDIVAEAINSMPRFTTGKHYKPPKINMEAFMKARSLESEQPEDAAEKGPPKAPTPKVSEAQRARWRTYRPASYQPPSKALLDAFNAKCAVTRAAIRKFAAQREEAAAKGPPKAPTPDAGPQPPAPPAPDAEDTSDDAKETTG